MFGLSFTIIQLDSIQIEVMCFAVVDFMHFRNSPQSIVSTLVALLVLCYFIFISYGLLILSAFVLTNMRQDQQDTLRSTAKGHRLSRVSVLWEDYRLPKRRIDLLMPLIYMVRSALISISVFLHLEHPWAQVTWATAVETGLLYLTLTTQSKQTKLQNRLDAAICSLNVGFLLLKTASLYEVSDFSRQVLIGIPMAVILLLGALLNITFLFISILIMLKDTGRAFIRHCKRICKDSSKTRPQQASTISPAILDAPRPPEPQQPQAASKQRTTSKKIPMHAPKKRLVSDARGSRPLEASHPKAIDGTITKQQSSALVSHKKKMKSGLLDINLHKAMQLQQDIKHLSEGAGQ